MMEERKDSKVKQKFIAGNDETILVCMLDSSKVFLIV
jgi:hypothetical protein